jgi:hypothetical protein
MAGEEYQITRRGAGGFQCIRFRPGVGITGLEFENTARRESATITLGESDVPPEQ